MNQNAKRDAEREKRIAEMMSSKDLLARGEQRVYRGEHLTAISFGVGGFGAGLIQMNGMAERAIWQIFNNYSQATVPNSFFAVRAKSAGGEAVMRALQTSPAGPFESMESLSFRGEYPFAWYDFEDADLPLAVSMEAFSPLVPMNTKDSAIPCAVFNLTGENTSEKAVDVSFIAAQQNAVGYTGKGKIEGRQSPRYGGNRNRILVENSATILHMTGDISKKRLGFGDMALIAQAENVTADAAWTDAKAFAGEGKLDGPNDAGPSPKKQTLDGALAAAFTLEPGEKRTVTFVLTWYFPNACHSNHKGWRHVGNMYTNWWPDALAVARYVNANIERLTAETRLFHDTFYSSNLPHWLLDRISSQVAVLRSKTCFWAKDGFVGAWEGCCPDDGCCHGNCTHVWHYAQSHARLFPEMARSMRQQIYAAQRASGALPHRLSEGFGPAADGELGDILGVYREYLCSTDREWLDGIWPKAQKAMNHAIATWDDDEDGVLAGAQHNTLDGSLGGSTSWIGTMYLAALEASARMAEIEGDPGCAERYRRIRKSGAKKQNETLWNGEYYIQIRDPEPRNDYADGCSIDQVLGEWWANQVNIPTSYPDDRVRGALRSLLKYNFRTNFHGVPQEPRKFVDEDDAGMQMIHWPSGDRPEPTILYGDEAMTGFEYSAAAAMVQFGMLREGFMVTRAIYDRYDGRLRTGLTEHGTASWGYSGNPFGDDECGKFYARAMSNWSILLACQGFVYDGPEGVLGFKPVWMPEDHASFFTAAEGWGLFSQKRVGRSPRHGRQLQRIELKYGRVDLRELVFELAAGAAAAEVVVKHGGGAIPANFEADGSELCIRPASPIRLEAGETLHVEISTE